MIDLDFCPCLVLTPFGGEVTPCLGAPPSDRENPALGFRANRLALGSRQRARGAAGAERDARRGGHGAQGRGVVSGQRPSICLICFFFCFCFPLLVLKGTDHYWKYNVFLRGLNQMEEAVTQTWRRLVRKVGNEEWNDPLCGFPLQGIFSGSFPTPGVMAPSHPRKPRGSHNGNWMRWGWVFSCRASLKRIPPKHGFDKKKAHPNQRLNR